MAVTLRPNAIDVKPFDFLKDVSWTTRLITVTDSRNLFDKVDFTIRPLTAKKSKLIKKAYVLFAIFRTRAPAFIQGRVIKSKQSHLVWP